MTATTEPNRQIKAAQNALKSRALLLRDYADKMDQYARELESASDGFAKPADRMEWAINDLENMLRNLNLASLAREACRLAANPS